MISPVFSSFLKDDLLLYIQKRELELSPRSIKNEISYLKSFDESLTEFSDDNVDIEFIIFWISSLSRLSDGSVNNYITSVRGFLKYENAIRNKHYFIPDYRTYPDTYIPYYFTSNDKNNIYTIVDSYKSGANNLLPWINAELPMIVRIIDGCGTRISEILQLRLQDIDFENAVIIIRNAKKDKQRRVPMSESLFEILSNYCHAMGIWGNPEAYLFPRKSRNDCLKIGDISGNRFTPVLSKLGIRNKEDQERNERGPCLYNFRHTFAVDAYKQLHAKGMSLDDTVCYLSIYLGHEDIAETQRYLKSCLEIFPEAVDKFYDSADDLAPKEDKWERWGL